MADQSNSNPFLELSSYAIVGALAGLYLGFIFDSVGWQLTFWSEAVVRLLAGAGDSIGEILFISYFFFKTGKKHVTISYVLGKMIGMAVAVAIHFLTTLFAYQPHGLISVFYVSAYSNFDNLFGGLTYLIIQIKTQGGFKKGIASFMAEPYQVGNMLAVLSLFSLVSLTRFIGVIPLTHSFSALESGILDTDSILASVYARLIGKKRKLPLS